MTRPRAALLDYGMGNIHSAAKALERAGFDVRLAADGPDVAGDVCVVPGVGHFGHCMARFTGAGFEAPVREWHAGGRPLLGICVGAQMLFEGSDESDAPGLGLLPGRVRRLDAERLPHIGWTMTEPGAGADGLFPGPERYYFVHSFGLAPADDGMVAAFCPYGGGFAAAVADGSVLATQFHPEKSGAAGLALLDRLRRRL